MLGQGRDGSSLSQGKRSLDLMTGDKRNPNQSPTAAEALRSQSPGDSRLSPMAAEVCAPEGTTLGGELMSLNLKMCLVLCGVGEGNLDRLMTQVPVLQVPALLIYCY